MSNRCLTAEYCKGISTIQQVPKHVGWQHLDLTVPRDVLPSEYSEHYIINTAFYRRIQPFIANGYALRFGGKG